MEGATCNGVGAAPRTVEGLSQRARWKHWLYSAEALAEQKRARELLFQSRELLKQMQADRIGRRIREIRGFNLTQAEFGRILGVGQTQLSKYERSQRADSGGASETKSAHSGRSIDWIVTG